MDIQKNKIIVPIHFFCLGLFLLETFTIKNLNHAAEPNPIHTKKQPHSSSEEYTEKEIDYFFEIALGAEFGNSTAAIRKWTDDIRIQVVGTTTEQDRQTLEQVIEELNQLVDGIDLKIDPHHPNIELYFVPEATFRDYEPNYIPTNLGFFWVLWNANHECYFARILISTTGVSQQERSHLIREEFTQALGLMNDSYAYEDSIFYQGWTDVTNYSGIDRAAIEILYNRAIEPGMTPREVRAVLEN